MSDLELALHYACGGQERGGGDTRFITNQVFNSLNSSKETLIPFSGGLPGPYLFMVLQLPCDAKINLYVTNYLFFVRGQLKFNSPPEENWRG